MKKCIILKIEKTFSGVNNFRKEQKLLFYLSIVGIIFNVLYGLTLKLPTFFGDADIINYFFNNFLGNLFWGITISTIFYYINVWIPEKKKMESLHISMDKHRHGCIKAFNIILSLMTTYGQGWSQPESEEIMKLIDDNVLLSNDQINLIANNFHNNNDSVVDNLRHRGIAQRIQLVMNYIEKLLIIYGTYLSPEETKLLDELEGSLFVRDIVTNNNGNEMYTFYTNVYKLKNFCIN